MKTSQSHSKRRASDHLHRQAFDYSFLPNIISIVSDGKIIGANQAASKLLGYSQKALLTKKMNDIFNIADDGFEQIKKQRKVTGHAIGNLTLIKKSGKRLSCQITSVQFIGTNHIKKAITTIADRSESINRQIDFDFKTGRLGDLEQQLDREISEKEKLYSSSQTQQTEFEQQLKERIKLQGLQMADAVAEAKDLERSELGKELHDNVNQLLAASRMYLDIARKNKPDREMYLNRSSEYTLTAIEEIRKLTKGLINDAIQHHGLCESVHKITQDLMEVYPIKIVCSVDDEIQGHMNPKFNHDVFRIVQEQLNNIIKHAKASEVEISLSQSAADIILSISDNGVGFDTAKKRKGIGITNIKSRVASHKGRAQFVSEPGLGCILRVTFPLMAA